MENMDNVISNLPKTSSLKPFSPPSSRINVGNAERWISLGAAALLSTFGIIRKDKRFLSLLAPAAYLAFRGATGYCPLNAALKRNSKKEPKEVSLSIFQKITVNKPVEEVYSFWRNLDNLPKVMQHISEISWLEGRTFKWRMILPVTHLPLSWDAVIIEDVKNERISWRSLEGSEIMNAGEVRFRVINSMRTEIQVQFNYAPPMGYAGKAFAGLLQGFFSKMIRADIKRVKSYLETGEIENKKVKKSKKKKVLL